MPKWKTVVVYKLGEGYLDTPEGPLRSWPYTVHYAPDHRPDVICIAEGDARHGNGAFMTAAAALDPKWEKNLATAGVEWLIPLLQRIAAGERVGQDEVFAAYRAVYGETPAREEWNMF